MSSSSSTGSYLGKRGYVVYKSELAPEREALIRRELTARPFIQSSYGPKEAPFPVYMENKAKLYLPKFAGKRLLGEPAEMRVPEGEDVSLEFAGELRDFQLEPVSTMMRAVKEKGGGILSLPGGKGKCMARGTLLLMASGEECAIEDIREGDLLMGDDSQPRRVLTTCAGVAPLYRIELPDFGLDYTVNGDHILCLRRQDSSEVLEISVEDYLKKGEELEGWGGYAVPVTYPERPLLLDPYMAGHWIAGGGGPLLSTAIHKLSLLEFYRIRERSHIPDDFRFNTIRNRGKLLAGFVDVRGFGRKGEYILGFPAGTPLIYQVTRVAQSMGLAVIEERYPHPRLAREVYHEFSFARLRAQTFLAETEAVVLRIRGPGLWHIRSQIDEVERGAQAQSYSKMLVTEVGRGDYFGFTLDGNGRYLLASAVVTHNTVMGLKLIQELGKKCLVIVHKEFLLSQWHERIRQFLPGARVGLIQAETIDIEDKDIVIGMLQSLSMKDYPLNQFDSFGTVVIDECHRIPCRVFSQVLFKVNSTYMIGLTATPTRSDGLFQVLEWFVGGIEYALKEDTKSNSRQVGVRRLIYNRDGKEDYKREQLNAMGKLNDGAMMTALCEYRPRTEAICRAVWEVALEGRSTLILSERIKHLEEMEAIFLERLRSLYDLSFLDELDYTVDWEGVERAAKRKGVAFQGVVPVYEQRRKVEGMLDMTLFRKAQTLAHDLADQMEEGGETSLSVALDRLRLDLKNFIVADAMLELVPVPHLEVDPFAGETLAKRHRMARKLADVESNRLVKEYYATLAKRATLEKERERCERQVRTSLGEIIKAQCYEAILARNRALTLRVAYYIGGMRESALKESEVCEIILGSYQMASEGLDIPSLNTLFLATPKSATSNVFKQSTWRIMRKEHERYKPLIIDFCDLHSKYLAQANKRKGYYRQRKYDLVHVEVAGNGEVISVEEGRRPKGGEGRRPKGGGLRKKEVEEVVVVKDGVNPFMQRKKRD